MEGKTSSGVGNDGSDGRAGIGIDHRESDSGGGGKQVIISAVVPLSNSTCRVCVWIFAAKLEEVGVDEDEVEEVTA